jgi:hypothetical protein
MNPSTIKWARLAVIWNAPGKANAALSAARYYANRKYSFCQDLSAPAYADVEVSLLVAKLEIGVFVEVMEALEAPQEEHQC